jgi:hypothetical protein
MDDASAANGSPRWRPAVPTVVVVASVLVALISVSGLILVLFQQTVGPGEVLRDFAERLAAEDCAGTYSLLDDRIREAHTEEAWCPEIPALAQALDPGFKVERVVLVEEVARIQVSGADTVAATWYLRRHGRSWRVLGAGEAVDFLGENPS